VTASQPARAAPTLYGPRLLARAGGHLSREAAGNSPARLKENLPPESQVTAYCHESEQGWKRLRPENVPSQGVPCPCPRGSEGRQKGGCGTPAPGAAGPPPAGDSGSAGSCWTPSPPSGMDALRKAVRGRPWRRSHMAAQKVWGQGGREGEGGAMMLVAQAQPIREARTRTERLAIQKRKRWLAPKARQHLRRHSPCRSTAVRRRPSASPATCNNGYGKTGSTHGLALSNPC
jgi:hypothetical protein